MSRKRAMSLHPGYKNAIFCWEKTHMKKLSAFYLTLLIGTTMLTAPSIAQQVAQAVTVGAGDLGGVVTGPGGPEAGVWVIAETRDLPTKYAKTVVTDDQGRYVIPDLPTANYQVWV